MSALSLIDANVKVGTATLLDGANLTADAGKMVGLIGPNGAGKTTAIKALLGEVPLMSGSALIEGRAPHLLSARTRAQRLAYLPQARDIAWPMSVNDVVGLGRFAYGGASGRQSQNDKRAVDTALNMCDLTDFKQRSVASLSGGELARVHMARAFAAQTPILIADEPIAALDPRHAFEVLELLKAKAQSGAAVLVILHDLNLAAQFCDELIVMHEGKTVAQGQPSAVLSSELIRQVFAVTAKWLDGQLIVQRAGTKSHIF